MAKKAWLWFADRHDHTELKYPADKYAQEVNILVQVLRPILFFTRNVHSLNMSEEILDDLLMYILKRHVNAYLKDNISMWWE